MKLIKLNETILIDESFIDLQTELDYSNWTLF